MTLPREAFCGLDPRELHASLKVVHNCERLLFQRPDDAIEPGADPQAEADIASDGVFLSNFEPLNRKQVEAIVDHVVHFDRFTEPMKRRLIGFLRAEKPRYAVCSANARIVDGKPTKNPRYQQPRPDLANPRETYLAEVCARLDRGWRRTNRWIFRSIRCFPDAGRIRRSRKSACLRWRSTGRFTIRSCRSCSWISSAA